MTDSDKDRFSLADQVTKPVSEMKADARRKLTEVAVGAAPFDKDCQIALDCLADRRLNAVQAMLDRAQKLAPGDRDAALTGMQQLGRRGD